MLTRHSTKMSQDGSCIIRKDCEVPPMPVQGATQRQIHVSATFPLPMSPALRCLAGLVPPPLLVSVGQPAQPLRPYLENGSDFPTGKPLPWVLVSTFPQCTATWQSFCSTNRQYSCCCKRKWGQIFSLLNKVSPVTLKYKPQK